MEEFLIDENFLNNWEDAGAKIDNTRYPCELVYAKLEKLRNKLLEIRYNKEHQYYDDHRVYWSIDMVEKRMDRNTPCNYGKISADVFNHILNNCHRK